MQWSMIILLSFKLLFHIQWCSLCSNVACWSRCVKGKKDVADIDGKRRRFWNEAHFRKTLIDLALNRTISVWIMLACWWNAVTDMYIYINASHWRWTVTMFLLPTVVLLYLHTNTNISLAARRLTKIQYSTRCSQSEGVCGRDASEFSRATWGWGMTGVKQNIGSLV